MTQWMSFDDQSRLKNEIDELKQKLNRLDVEIPEMEEPEKSDFGDSPAHPHRRYMNEQNMEQALERYRDRLKKLLDEHRETK